MTKRAPLVLISGQVSELPASDVISGSSVFPFYNAAAIRKSISLPSGGYLPFYIASGAASNINLVGA